MSEQRLQEFVQFMEDMGGDDADLSDFANIAEDDDEDLSEFGFSAPNADFEPYQETAEERKEREQFENSLTLADFYA